MSTLLDLTKGLLRMRKIPTRYCIAFMIFTNTLYFITLRAIISINLVAMVPVNVNMTSESDTGLTWTAYERGTVLSSYYWGCLIGVFFAGPVLELVSIRKALTACLFGVGVLTLLGPLAARQGVEFMILSRFCVGILSGFYSPGNYSLISKWSTPLEKGMFVGAFVLASMGTFFAWSIGGYVVDTFGWEWGFYVFGIFGPFIAGVFWLTVYDTPEEHPRITAEEQKYLQNEIKRNRETKLTPPFRRIYTSGPVWSVVMNYFGLGWGLHFLNTSAPNYIANTLGYSITSTGLMSAFIYLFRSLVGFGAGTISDVLLKKNKISLKVLRNGGIFFSHVIPGCGLLFMLKMGFPPISYIIIIGISMAFNGMTTLSCAVNSHDLTVNYVSTVIGLAVSSMTIAGIVTPLVTAHLTKEDETDIEEWRSVFLVGASVYLISGLQFFIFGSIKKQPWDQIEIREEKRTDITE